MNTTGFAFNRKSFSEDVANLCADIFIIDLVAMTSLLCLLLRRLPRPKNRDPHTTLDTNTHVATRSYPHPCCPNDPLIETTEKYPLPLRSPYSTCTREKKVIESYRKA